MTVREYYYAHFHELSPEKKFHFATRIKNYFHCDDFADYFKNNIPSQNLDEIFENHDFSKVNRADLRAPYFQKYNQLFEIEAALFRVNHLLNEYNIDIRDQFLYHVPLERLYNLSDSLLSDNVTLAILSTWAVNVICLTEILFPRGKNVVEALANKDIENLEVPVDPLLLIYFYTHIILCDTNFYTRPVQNSTAAKKILSRAGKIIDASGSDLILDARLEFLVCANLVNNSTSSSAGNSVNDLVTSIRVNLVSECLENLSKNPFLVDSRRPDSFHTLNGAEHTNVLFIMSGLDD